ncbi:MAG: siphovirus Gp157 family protein [Prochloraceae cyanobacterium]|nr:siphovirus Gp157 family protein [Prochloraceae cyanobacterium]
MTNNNSLWGQTNQLEDLEQQWLEIDLSYLPESEKEKARSEIFQEWIDKAEDWEAKIESCGYAAKCLEKEAEAIASMISDLKSRQQRKEAEAKRLKTYMMMAMQSQGIAKVKGKYSTIYTSTSSSVQLSLPIEELPSKYHKQKIEAHKQLIKKDLTAGKPIKGAKIEQRSSLVIRIK